MSDDPKAIAGSEAYAGAGGGCTVWLDNNGSGYLYGMLNTSLYESCNAQLFRSDGLKVSLTARYAAERTSSISDIGHTMWICVWEKEEVGPAGTRPLLTGSRHLPRLGTAGAAAVTHGSDSRCCS